jgi:hypothetical protein
MLVYRGGSVFVDPQAIHEWEDVNPALFEPVKKKGYEVFAYVEFPSLQRAEVGFAILKGGPEGEVVDKTDVTTIHHEQSVAPLLDFNDALKELKETRRPLIEEFPFVEVTRKKDYNELLLASLRNREEKEARGGPIRQWSPGEKKPKVSDKELIENESLWTEAGVYDLRDVPPSHHASVVDYEVEGMNMWADDAMEWLYQGQGEKDTVMPLEVLLERQEAA